MRQDEGSLKLAAGTKDGHSGASASASARIKRGECGKREEKLHFYKEEKLRKFNINLYAKTCILSFRVVILSSRVEKHTQLTIRADCKVGLNIKEDRLQSLPENKRWRTARSARIQTNKQTPSCLLKKSTQQINSRMAQQTTLTDEELVRAYAQGSNDAFDTLLKRHQDRIYNYILRIIKSEDVANDIFQETFVKAIQTIRQGRYTENGKFPAWISRIAHNLIIDYYRQEKSENLQSTDLTDVNVLNRKELCEQTIEDVLISDQIKSDVKMLIEELPELQRQVLKMRYYQSLSFKEIAEITGVSINTALGRMRYAILNLRRIAAEKDIVLTL